MLTGTSRFYAMYTSNNSQTKFLFRIFNFALVAYKHYSVCVEYRDLWKMRSISQLRAQLLLKSIFSKTKPRIKKCYFTFSIHFFTQKRFFLSYTVSYGTLVISGIVFFSKVQKYYSTKDCSVSHNISDSCSFCNRFLASQF